MIRIKDIAERAGVSIGTVDRVLHNRGEVADKTKKLVLNIAEEMHYTPNIAASTLASKKMYNLAALLPKGIGDNIFWDRHIEGMRSAVASLQPFQVNISYYLFELNNEKEFIEQAKLLLENSVDGVIIAPVMKKEASELCFKLDKKNIPYIFIDTFIESTNCLAFIGEDAYQSGRISASLIDFGLAKDKDILIVNISKNLENTQHLNSRNQGFLSYFVDAGKNKGLKISIEIPSNSPEDIEAKLDPIFQDNAKIGAIMVSSAKTHTIAHYLEKRRKRDIILVGYEIFDENIRYLKKRYINFLISQKPHKQGEKAVFKLFYFLANKTIPDKKEYQAIDIINYESLSLLSQ